VTNMELRKHARFLYQPVLPLGKHQKMVTNSASHRKIALQIAEEGVVLLKNSNNTLPLKRGARICLFGIGAGDYLLGGGGSGAVFTEQTVTLADGLQNAAQQGEIAFFTPLVDFYSAEIRKITDQAHQVHPTPEAYNVWRAQTLMPLPVLPDALYEEACAFGDTALFCVSRYSAEGDRAGDRQGTKGDFYLWDEEQQLLDRLCKDFERVIVILNTCGPVSTAEYKNNSRIGALLYPLYGGSAAGEALTRILLGKSFPSGHLQDTLAQDLNDYPSTAGFHDHTYHPDYKEDIFGSYQYAPISDPVYHTEDIFVGYRWFETFAPEKVVYPFGFGLSYTTFSIQVESAAISHYQVRICISVRNTGSYSGKQVVQLYLSAPQGKLGKAKKVLCAFAKTKTLLPGEQTLLKLHFDLRDFASFDDLGKISPCAFLLEKGQYTVHVGDNVRDTQPCLSFTLDEDIICQTCHPYLAPRDLKERMTADGSMEKLPQGVKQNYEPMGYQLTVNGIPQQFSLETAYAENRLDEFIASLTAEELAEMLYGQPIMNPSNTNGIGLRPRYEREDVKLVPLVPTADGPMGLRIRKGRGVTPTFFPCENTVSQTWNLELAQKAAVCIAREAKENNIGIWLAPALNIHRNPMCGRNFEYYSEDPLTSGLFACAAVKGVQSQKIAATAKHYCANNREIRRRLSDACVSMRALREIYLRGFEIVIKKAQPWALMTSYNRVNGEQVSKSWEAINGILRGEWNYEGVVMTDWRALSNIDEELHAGSDVKMPELITRFYADAPQTYDLPKSIHEGKVDRTSVYAAVRRILLMMQKLD